MRRLFGWLKRIRGRAPPELPLEPEAGSPERLDELVVIARPRMWISLAVLVALLGVLVAWSFIGDIPTKLDGRAMFAFANGPVTVDAPADGRITGRLARLDQRVRVGQPLLRIRTGRRTVVVRSPVDGVVAIRAPLPDDAVRRGEAVFKINPLDRRLRLFAYMPLSDAKSVVRGLDVQVSPSNAPKAAFGFIEGKVAGVSGYPVSGATVAARAGERRETQLASHLLGGEPKLEVEIGLARDPEFVDRSTGDIRDDVLACRELVERQGMEFLVLDQTRPDIGMPVTKVLVPGMRHFWARFGPGRLYDVPLAMGWLDRPRAESELNPIPMFV